MSVLAPEVHAALTELLRVLQSTDNVQRVAAEEQLNSDWVTHRPGVLLMGLAEQLAGADDQSLRSFAAVLFRRVASRTRKEPGAAVAREMFLTLQQDQRNAIRAMLLQALPAENMPMVRNKISDAVAEIARQYTEEGEQWPDLLGALFQCSQSPDSGQRETAFRIFATTPGIIEKQHEEVVLGAFAKGFKDDDVPVRLAAVEAFASFFRSINRKSQQKYYSLIPDILNILPPLKESGDSEQLTKALLALIELAEVAPKMFKPLFTNLVTFSVTVVQDKELGDVTRQNALELMVTFAEKAPAMCKKDTSFTSEMVTQCLSLMTDVGADDDDASEWCLAEDLENDESDSNHCAGEQCMDRLANQLGGQVLLPPTFNWLPRMMQSSAWRDRHAALMAISAISEGCRDLMLGELDKVLELVIPALRDPHPRVRWAGCNALGQMSTDFAGTMQNNYHQAVLPNIIPVLEATEPRVQAHAAAALVNFCEEAEKEVLEPYLDNLIQHLLLLLQSPKRFVQEQALSTIATVADSAESTFGKFYDILMPLLFNVLKNEQDREYRLLRAKAMECATLIALAVGKERMQADSIELVNILGNIQQNITESDDPQASYLLHCWGRMCRVLDQDFVPYLPTVIPPLAEMAGAKADIQLLDDDDQVAQIEQEDGWELVPLKGKVIGIKTSTLEDKHMAIDLITVYAQVLHGAFEPYVNDIMDKIALPSLAFFFHDPVRIAAAHCVPILLDAYKRAHGPESTALGQLWERTVEKVLEVLSAEPAIETLAMMYECFHECVECIGKGCLTATHMATFVQCVRTVLDDYQERVRDREDEKRDQDTEGEEANEDTLIAIEDDQTLLSNINKAFHSVFKHIHPVTAFLPHWERLMDFYDGLLGSPDPINRQWSLCIFDDLLEFAGPLAAPYASHFALPIASALDDADAGNRQAAAYGVGIVAQKCLHKPSTTSSSSPSSTSPQQQQQQNTNAIIGSPAQASTSTPENAWAQEFLARCLSQLFAITQRPDARSDEDVYATENACAAIAKILHFAPDVPAAAAAARGAASDPGQAWQECVAAWVDTLPIVNDDEAAPYGYGFLAELVERQNPAVLSQAQKCLQHIVQALEGEALQGQTAQRIVHAAVRPLMQVAGVGPDGFLAGLTGEIRDVVGKALVG